MLIASVVGFVMSNRDGLNAQVRKYMRVGCFLLLIRSLLWPALDYFLRYPMQGTVTQILSHALVATAFIVLLKAARMKPN